MEDDKHTVVSEEHGDGFSDRKVAHSKEISPRSGSDDTSTDDGGHPRHQSYNRVISPGLGEYCGEWEIGEQELSEPCKSETEETPSSETRDKSDGESTSSSGALSNVYAKLSPFAIRWSFGINCNVGLINLTTGKSYEVYYVSSHFGIVYNYRTKSMTFLPGHNYSITSIAADASGRWLVSADAGEDTVIIVWDNKKKIPAWSLYNVFPRGVRYAAISQDARFLAAINCDFPSALKFWLWTYGREEADGVIDVDPAYGTARHIDFNHLETEQFAVTTDLQVIFCEWKRATREIKTFAPALDTRKKKPGNLRKTIFLDDNTSALSSTSQGYVVLWRTRKYNESDKARHIEPMDKVFFKALMLHKVGITDLKLRDGIIVSSSEDGTILFHDQELRLVYWQLNLKPDPVTAISFNIDNIPLIADPFAPRFHSVNQESADEEVENIFEYDAPPHQTEESKLVKTALSKSTSTHSHSQKAPDSTDPTDCTLEMRPFPSRDFMFLTTTGKLAYVSHKRRKVRYYLYATAAPLVSIDCNPRRAHIMVGDTRGRLVLYDYNLKKMLLTANFPSAITTLKFSRLAQCVIAGFQNGDLLELHPLLLTVTFKFELSKSKIEKLCFSYNDNLIAFYDQSSTVHVFKGGSNRWVSMGRYISHYKPIVDISFEDRPPGPDAGKVTRLFTMGQDRMLVEYDLNNLEENKLKILSMIRVEQTSIPCCFTWLYEFYKAPHFLVSNDQYKLKVFDSKSFICQKTTLGPTADTPIKSMKIITNAKSNRPNLVYVTEKHIGLRLLPPTGNPFEGIGMIGHPDKITAFAISYDHSHVFTIGENDNSLLMWEINAGCLEVASQLGGVGLEPYVSLIEGGPNSFLFKEIEDFFYYAQIIHQGEDPNLDRSVSRSLALCEIPDLFRALGYYPTDYEVENLLHELKYLDYNKTGRITTEITFDECVKAFLNHRPVHGISINHINNALLAIADLSDPSDVIVERNELYKALEERAEAMDHAEAVGYLCILLLPKDENNPVPPSISLREFTENVLGIDLTISEENVREITHAFEKNN